MPDIVHEMHAKSGLLSELKTDGTHAYRYLQNPANVCGSAVYWLSERVGLETGLPLSGSSPHFDRGFLQQQMLPLENWFHYRAGVDASALRETFKRINKSVVDTQPEKYEKHRPVPDLADSIRLFRHMLRTGFVLDEATKGRLGV
jgi:oligoribonuclease (3'-5' exoribonuclease)